MTPEPPITAFVSIANVDDALSAQQWAAFHGEIVEMLQLAGAAIQGQWYCGPVAPWQTACWCIDIQPGIAERLKGELAVIGVRYGRGAVGWYEVGRVAVLG